MDNYFTVSPFSQTMSLEPGYVYSGTIKVAIPASATEEFHYQATVTPYSVLGEEYTADLTTTSDMSQIVDWIEIENPTGVIEPNGAATVKFTVEVPLDAPAGGQYATISVRSNQATSEATGVQIQNVFEIASIIYANVAGETIEKGEILDNDIPGFVTNATPTVGALLANDGNVHQVVSTTLTIKNVFTGDVVFPKDSQENTFSEMIMPYSTRYITRELSDLPALGIFSVTQDIKYMGETNTVTSNVIMCPLWFLLLVILTVGTLIGTIAGLIFRRHRHRIHYYGRE